MSKNIKILIVDDMEDVVDGIEKELLHIIKKELVIKELAINITIYKAYNILDALDLTEDENINMFFIDYDFKGGLDGYEFITELNNEYKNKFMVLMTSHDELSKLTTILTQSNRESKDNEFLFSAKPLNKLTIYDFLIKSIEYFSKINSENKNLEIIVKKLPFPLSSILWRYNIEDNKEAHLFNYFEAVSKYLSIIILSYFIKDKKFYNENKNTIKSNRKTWYERPSFGNWNKCIERYSDVLNNSKSNLIPKNLKLLIINKEFLTDLNEIAILRNEWKGHGGFAGEKEAQKRIKILNNYLEKINKNLIEAFDRVLLIKGDTCSSTRTIKKNTVFNLNGIITPFSKQIIESKEIFNTETLYLCNLKDSTSIPLLPLIEFIENNEGCFFYNGVIKNDTKNIIGVKFVSYHYDKKSEYFCDDEYVLENVKKL